MTATFVFPSGAFRDRPGATSWRKGASVRWHHACLSVGMSDTAMQSAYYEPTVMWRMRRAGGQSSHAIIGPRLNGVAVMWFVNGHPVGLRDFDDCIGALRWSEQIQAQNWAAGWRLASE